MFLFAETFEILQEALVTHLSNTLQPQWQRRNWTGTEQSADVNPCVLKKTCYHYLHVSLYTIVPTLIFY